VATLGVVSGISSAFRLCKYFQFQFQSGGESMESVSWCFSLSHIDGFWMLEFGCWIFGAIYLMVLPVRRRIHWGMGRFWR
jgi:hypothetical protein